MNATNQEIVQAVKAVAQAVAAVRSVDADLQVCEGRTRTLTKQRTDAQAALSDAREALARIIES